jgi:hypothetical protein
MEYVKIEVFKLKTRRGEFGGEDDAGWAYDAENYTVVTEESVADDGGWVSYVQFNFMCNCFEGAN